MKIITRKKQYLKILGILTVSLWIAVAALVGLQVHNVVTNKSLSSRTAGYPVQPKIIEAPQSKEVDIMGGDWETLSVKATVSDGGRLVYQWFKQVPKSVAMFGSVVLYGETRDTLAVPISAVGATTYFVQVGNNIGSKTTTLSNLYATITVREYTPTIKIEEQPQNRLVSIGDEIDLSVNATAEQGTITYQWYKGSDEQASNGVVIPNATNKTLRVPTDKEGTYFYYAIAENTIGEYSWTSTSVVSRVDVVQEKMDNPIILNQPKSIEVYQNDTAKLSVEATGGGQLRYQWYYNTQGDSTDGGKALSGQTQRELSLVAINLQTYYYFVIVTNDTGAANSGSVVSDIVQIKVLEREDNNGNDGGDNGDNNGGDNNNNNNDGSDNGDNEDGWYQDNGDNNQITPTTSDGNNLPWTIMGVASLGLMSASVWLIVRKMG